MVRLIGIVFFIFSCYQVQAVVSDVSDIESVNRSIYTVLNVQTQDASFTDKMAQTITNIVSKTKNEDISEVLEQTMLKIGSVVRIHKSTGFFISPRLFVMTFHGLKDAVDAKNIILLNEEGRLKRVKNVVAVSVYPDLAILETYEDHLDYLAKGAEPELSNRFRLTGYLGEDFQLREILTTENLEKEYQHYTVFTNFCKNAFGMSGSPAVDNQGDFIGIFYAGFGAQKSIIKARYVDELMEGKVGTLCHEQSVGHCVQSEIQNISHMVDHYISLDVENPYEGTNLFYVHFAFLQELLPVHQVFQYMSAGADRGHPKAQYLLGNMYYLGIGTSKDLDKAISLWEASARQNHIDSKVRLGLVYAQREISNEEQFLSWFVDATKQNFMGTLNYMYYASGTNVKSSYFDHLMDDLCQN